jgi:hypothetical protein
MADLHTRRLSPPLKLLSIPSFIFGVKSVISRCEKSCGSHPLLYRVRMWKRQSGRPPERPTIVPVLRVEVQGSEIIVIASDTDYHVTYHKPDNSPQLIAKSYPRKEDRRVSMTLAEFLTTAWGLANDKARELGWIV